MRARRAAALALASVALLAGCGSAAPATSGPAAEAPPASAPFLATSLATAAGTWAVVVMGGSVATNDNFWQLFVRPAGSSTWKLVTPPGTADNGGLVLADGGAQSLITGFRPSQSLTFTPLILTRDRGQGWSPAGPLDGALADVPDALAAVPGSGNLLALLTDGTAELAAPRLYQLDGPGHAAITRPRRPPGAAAGCRTSPQPRTPRLGPPLLGGSCGQPGTVGIFAGTGGTWHAAGPAIPAALAGQDITVSRLTQTGQRLAALLTAGTGPAASLLAAWSADGGHWTLSPPLPLHGAALSSASFGPSGTAAVITTTNRGEIIASTRSSWQPLPRCPPARPH